MTLNKIIDELKVYFESHLMINYVVVTNDDDDFNALSDISYPVVNIQYLDTIVTSTLLTHNFKIIIGDLTNPNIQLIDYNIYSDCIQIADDFFGWLENNFSYDWDKNTTIDNFTDSNVDRVSGIVFPLSLSVRRGINSDCIAPHA